MSEMNVARGFFIALLLVVTLAFFWLIRGFLQPIFWAIALGIVIYPLHSRLAARLHERAGLAAIISVVIVVIVVILPLIGLGTAVAREGGALYERLQTNGLGAAGIFTRVQETTPRIMRTPCVTRPVWRISSTLVRMIVPSSVMIIS